MQTVGPTNSRQTMLDKDLEQMIIKSAYASNHELIKRVEQTNGFYLKDVQSQIEIHERDLL